MITAFLPLVLGQSPDPSSTSTTWDIDWPYTFGEWSLIGAFAVVAALSVWMYRRDARSLPGIWAYVLTGLRLAALAGLAVILLNPHTRTQTTGYRPSQVALLTS